jgi:hypothetical protein
MTDQDKAMPQPEPTPLAAQSVAPTIPLTGEDLVIDERGTCRPAEQVERKLHQRLGTPIAVSTLNHVSVSRRTSL